ncbi:hypothetical protein [Streptomyces sp. NPDC056144]|uniref:hypothetical protein n=1 Tax=unclassified Streptomyces TaxID=2593676 RepID=UPI0035DE92A0
MTFDVNEPQTVRDARLEAERAEGRARRRAAPVHLRDAHAGAALVTVALIVLGVFGAFPACGIVAGAFLLLFLAALTGVYVDTDHGRHAWRRAYAITFGWLPYGF